MYYTEVKVGTVIYTYEDYGTCFFIVERGKLELRGDEKSKKK